MLCVPVFAFFVCGLGTPAVTQFREKHPEAAEAQRFIKENGGLEESRVCVCVCVSVFVSSLS